MFNRKYGIMQGVPIVEGRKLFQELAHESDIIHGLIPMSKLFYFRMLDLNDLKSRGYKRQRVADFMCDGGYCNLMVFQQLADDLLCFFIFFKGIGYIIQGLVEMLLSAG